MIVVGQNKKVTRPPALQIEVKYFVFNTNISFLSNWIYPFNQFNVIVSPSLKPLFSFFTLWTKWAQYDFIMNERTKLELSCKIRVK